MKLTEELKRLLGLGGDSNKHVGRVLVLDGDDVVGHRVVERLMDAEYPELRVGSKTVQEATTSGGLLVETVPFDFNKEETYEAALKDVKTVFVTLPVSPANWDNHFPAFVKACHTAHVKRIVKQSFYHAVQSKAENRNKYFGEDFAYMPSHEGFHEVPLVHKHALCDGDLVLQKRFEVTLLFATHLMSNVFRSGVERKALKEKQEFYGASRGKGVNYVSPNDVADIAVKAIFEKQHLRQAHTLCGPTAITDEAVANLLSHQLDQTITFVEKPFDFFDKDTAAFEKIKASGVEETFPHGDFKRVMGREPESFEDYLKATARMTQLEQETLLFVETTPQKTTDVVMTEQTPVVAQ